MKEYPLSCPARGLEKDDRRSDHLSFGVIREAKVDRLPVFVHGAREIAPLPHRTPMLAMYDRTPCH